MNAKVSTRDSLEQIASDALDFVRYGTEQTKWMAALMKSIQLDLKHNDGRCALALAGLGHYLADDCTGYLDCQGEELQEKLDARKI